MKKLLLAGFATLLFVGCSDKTTTKEEYNPYRPISGLEIPREAIAGESLTLNGKGFVADCGLEFQLNGQAATMKAQVVSVDAKSLVINVPGSLDMGFYALLLTQNSATTKIGGVNVKVNKYTDDDFELYGLVGENLEISMVSVSKQVRPALPLPNSSTSVFASEYSGFAVGTPEGKAYFTGFDVGDRGKLLFSIGSYNLTTQTRKAPVSIEDFVAMGEFEGVLGVLKTSDNRTYTLVKWSDGVETEVQTFDLAPFGGSPILVLDKRFVYHAATNTILLSGNMGAGENMGKVAFSLNVETKTVNQNGGSAMYKYWLASTGEELYCFAVRDTEGEVATTQVYRIDNPQEWKINGEGSTLVATVTGSAFESPTYSPVTEKIYGFDDYENFGALLTFNPKGGNVEGRRWVGPGMACVFFAPRNEIEN